MELEEGSLDWSRALSWLRMLPCLLPMSLLGEDGNWMRLGSAMDCREQSWWDRTGLTPALAASSISSYSGEHLLDFGTARPLCLPEPPPLHGSSVLGRSAVQN